MNVICDIFCDNLARKYKGWTRREFHSQVSPVMGLLWAFEPEASACP